MRRSTGGTRGVRKSGLGRRLRRRPDPLRWIWYAFGGTLGPRYRQWVLRDLTGRTRWERQIARAVLQVAPLAVVLLLALGFGWIAWVGVGCGLVLALIYSTAYFDPSVEHRLAARISLRHRSTDPQRARQRQASGSDA